MRKLFILILLLAVFCSVSGCFTEQYTWKNQTISPYEPKTESLIQVSPISDHKRESEKEVSLKVTEEMHSSPQKSTTSMYETELQAGLILFSQKECNEAIDIFSSLTIRYPEQARVQYLLSFAYDKCGDTRKALKGYKDYVDMQPDDKVLMHKSRTRIRELRDKIAVKLIEEAQANAIEHNYDYCLETLEQAYDMCPSVVVANMIVEKYSTYSINSIAWDMSAHADSLQTKSVSVIPFTTLSGRESEQGKAVAGEIKSALINLQSLEVYVRDDDSIKALLKEIEFGQTGAIDEKTRKELGKLVSTETIITGMLGYVANTFKINSLMINVETGKIVSSKSVKMLGWNIEDTDDYAEFKTKVWMDRKVYNIGNMVKINFTSNRDCFVTLLNVRSNGEIWELFPNKYNPDNFVKANVRYTIPSANDDFRLAIVDPPGKEYIKAIATSTPITAEQISKVLSEDDSILITSTNRIRRGNNSIFRSVSTSEMRGFHEILTRGVSVLPGTNGTLEYKAVSTWSFETSR